MFKGTFKALYVVSATLLSISSTVYSAVYNDFDVKNGILSTLGSGPNIQQVNQQLEIAIPANSQDAPSDKVLGAWYTSTCLLHGDFDIQAGYSLLTFPASNGVRVGLLVRSATTAITVERTSRGQNESPGSVELYGTNIGGTISLVRTADKTGILRLTRTGGTLTGYYYNSVSKSWVAIGSGSATTEGLSFAVSAWSHSFNGIFAKKAVRIAFDNIIVNKGVFCSFTGQ